MADFKSTKLTDTNGVAQGVLMENGAQVTQSYLYSITEGDVANHTPLTKFGICAVQNSAIDVWEGNSVYVFPATAQKMDVTSTDNTNDNVGGTGALKIKINGLLADYSDATEEVTMTGTTIATTSASFLRINKIWVSVVGTGGMAAGTISVKGTGGSTVYGQISAGKSQSRQLIYTVPLGKTLYITSISFSSGVGNTTSSAKFNYVNFTTRAKVDPGTGAVSTIFYPFNEVGMTNQSFYRELEVPTRIPATADLKISVVGDTALAVNCVAAIRGWLE